MRKTGWTIVLLSLLIPPLCPQNPGIKSPTESYFKLENGLQVFLRYRPHTPLVNVVFAIGVGSRDDTQAAGGLVHILEHLMLLGSTRDTSNHDLIKRMRQHGIYFNAHTDHDLMTFELSAPANHLETMLTLAREKLFRFKPLETELAREKKIILEEINQIYDDPEQTGTSLVLQQLFSGHAYSHPIFGSQESIQSATLPAIEAFYNKYFIPNNMSVAVVGNLALPESRQLLKKLFKDLPTGIKPARVLPVVTGPTKNMELKKEMDVQQNHLFFGFIAPNVDHDDRLVMNVVTQIFGRGANPMLRSALRRGRRKLVERVSMRYITLKYGGAILIHMKVEPNRINSARRETIQFLKRARSLRFTKEDYPRIQQRYAFDFLDNARHHLNLLYQSYQEFGLMLATSYARSMMLQEKKRSESYMQRLSKVNSNDLYHVIQTYFSKGKYVTVIINPQDKK